MASDAAPLARVENDAVWRSLRTLFLGAMLLLVLNVALGLLNAVTVGPIPRWRVLLHLHSGAIGWITLSLIGLAIWLFTGRRSVGPGYHRLIRLLVWSAVVVFTGYVLGFGFAFSRGGPAFILLPVFGTAAMLVIWAATAYAVAELRHQPVVTNVHVLVTGGLLVAAVGATMGVALGVEYVVGPILPIVGVDRVGVHAGMMDAYILIVASALVEWFVLKDAAGRWTWPGVAQAGAGTIAAVIVPIAFLTNSVPTLLPVFGLLLLVFLALFLARMGWRAFRTDPRRPGVEAWGFMGAFWLVVYVVLFVYGVIGLQADFAAAPFWFGALFAHAAYVGMMTNLLFGLLSARAWAARDRFSRVEPAALWGLNAGILIFFATKVAVDVRHGAILMGIGVLLGLHVFSSRLMAAE